jgi:hypothetical protein
VSTKSTRRSVRIASGRAPWPSERSRGIRNLRRDSSRELLSRGCSSLSF